MTTIVGRLLCGARPQQTASPALALHMDIIRKRPGQLERAAQRAGRARSLFPRLRRLGKNEGHTSSAFPFFSPLSLSLPVSFLSVSTRSSAPPLFAPRQAGKNNTLAICCPASIRRLHSDASTSPRTHGSFSFYIDAGVKKGEPAETCPDVSIASPRRTRRHLAATRAPTDERAARSRNESPGRGRCSGRHKRPIVRRRTV